jgi:hypothetical protein
MGESRSHRPEQTSRFDRPVSGIERLVADVDEVDLAHDLPVDAAPVEVANPVGGDIGHVDLEHIAGGERRGLDLDPIRQAPGPGQLAAVEPDPGTVADVAEFEPPGIGRSGRPIELEPIARGPGKPLGCRTAELGPRHQPVGGKRGGQLGAAADKLDAPATGER